MFATSLPSPARVAGRFPRVSVRGLAVRRIVVMGVNVEQVESARQELKKILAEKHCNPMLVHLAFHDAGTYSKDVKEPWPKPGGANASIRFPPEMCQSANKGFEFGMGVMEGIKAKCPDISYADLIQLAAVVAIEEAGGPFIPLRLGRVDAASPEACTPDGRLPDAGPPFSDGAPSPAQHLHSMFGRMGLTNKDIVALSGAHTLGFGKASTKYTEHGPGAPGGQSFTVEWLKFDNSYFRAVQHQEDPDLLVMPTDGCLFEDERFRPFAEKYAADQDVFFADYTASHLKLSELGVKWDGEPYTLQPKSA